MSNLTFQFYEIKKLPVAILDNFYSQEESELIWQELCFLNASFWGNKLEPPEKTGSAKDEHGNLLKSNSGVFLDEVYMKRNISNILSANRKIFLPEITDLLCEKSYFFHYIKNSTKDSTLVQYYENQNYYESHRDKSVITGISWFYKTPKSFLGGDLIIEQEIKIECRPNRMVIFPSILFHEVEKITMETKLLNKNLGRHSISQFIT